MPLTLSSAAFSHQGDIPIRYTGATLTVSARNAGGCTSLTPHIEAQKHAKMQDIWNGLTRLTTIVEHWRHRGGNASGGFPCGLPAVGGPVGTGCVVSLTRPRTPHAEHIRMPHRCGHVISEATPQTSVDR